MDTDSGVIPFIDLIQQHRPIKYQLEQAINQILDSGLFVSGINVTAFEQEWASFNECKFSVGVNSGTDALRLGLLAMGIGPGMSVITVPNTFIATTEAISQTGAKFEFVDVDKETCLMDPNILEKMLKVRFNNSSFNNSSKSQWPACVLPVHLYGQCVDMDSVSKLAQEYGLKIIGDAAQAHGARYKGRSVGTLATLSCFSFYPGKNLGACGEAGAVTTDDPELAAKVVMLRDHGQSQKYYHDVEGYNARLDEIQAAILRIKLKYLKEWNLRRRKIADRYNQAFSKTDWVRPVHVPSYNESVHHLYVIQVPNRSGLRHHLLEKGIRSGLHYPVPLHLQNCYKYMGFETGSFPNAEKWCSESISLPIFPELDDTQVQKVIETVLGYGACL